MYVEEAEVEGEGERAGEEEREACCCHPATMAVVKRVGQTTMGTEVSLSSSLLSNDALFG